MVWIACTNPAQSLPNQAQVRAGLARAELVVLQEAYTDTETAAFADVLLPASTWGEKNGTATNSERRISRVRAAVPAPGEARADWQIACDFAQRLEKRLQPAYFAARGTLFNFTSPAEIFAEHASTTVGRDLDIGGLSHAVLDDRGPQQWPFAANATSGTERLYEDGVYPTRDGRARFAAALYVPVAEATDARFPLRLNTGRLRDQWHGMSRTGTVAQLFAHQGEAQLQMHALDMLRRDLVDGDLARVSTRRGTIVVPVAASDELKPGQTFLPMHWGSGNLGGEGMNGINALTTAARCPQSGQPELKHAALRVTKAELPWQVAAFGFPHDGDALALRATLRAMMEHVPFASVVLIGRGRDGVLFRAAFATPAHAAWLAALDAAFALVGSSIARYDDAGRGISRVIRVEQGKLEAVRLSGDTIAEGWLRDYLLAERDVMALRQRLLLPSAQPPSGFVARGRVVCTCFDVAEAEVRFALTALPDRPDDALAQLQRTLKCGTNCGSCLPDLRRLCATATRQVEAPAEA